MAADLTDLIMNRSDRRSGGPRQGVTEQTDLRTPIAWQQRNNMNFQQQQPQHQLQHQQLLNQQQHHHQHQQYKSYSERAGMGDLSRMPGHFQYSNDELVFSEDMTVVGQSSAVSRSRRARSSNNVGRAPSVSTDTITSTSTGERDNDSQYNRDLRQSLGSPQTLGTLCSVRSTVTTWDGEPCPIHHLTLMPMQPMQPMPPMMYPHPHPHPHPHLPPPCHPMLAHHPPAVLLPPMLRPRPLVQPADTPAPPEPLPVRSTTSLAMLPQKENGTAAKSKPIKCCQGNIIVLWIILCIIFTGLVVGTVLSFVFA